MMDLSNLKSDSDYLKRKISPIKHKGNIYSSGSLNECESIYHSEKTKNRNCVLSIVIAAYNILCPSLNYLILYI